MMGMLLSILFMIPVGLFGNFWLVVFLMFIMSGFLFMKFSVNSSVLMLSYSMGLDQLSFLMVLLSFWICSLMLLASYKIYQFNNYVRFFVLIIIILLLSLYVAFSSLTLFMFYIFFEISMIPTLFLIVGWGYQPERLQAGMYMFFYTMLASLPMLVCLFYYYYKFNNLLILVFFFDFNSFIYFLFFTLVFFVKMPLFMLHLWLPKAHVEAPVSGSMILAGIMLKLGGYGLMRVLSLFSSISLTYSSIYISISLVGGSFVSLICLRQSDIKSLIAYSSVVHMGMIVCGLFTFSMFGMVGSLALMLAHGLCSSGLFCLVNINYERIHSRSLYLNKGMINILPSLSLCWFLLCSSNMACPPSFNLFSELLLLSSIMFWGYEVMVLLFLFSFFSAAYSLFLYSYTQHGGVFKGLLSFYVIEIREFLLLFIHWLPLNLMFLKSSFFCLWV